MKGIDIGGYISILCGDFSGDRNNDFCIKVRAKPAKWHSTTVDCPLEF